MYNEPDTTVKREKEQQTRFGIEAVLDAAAVSASPLPPPPRAAQPGPG
jgi:hypothetical protein